MTSLRNLAVLFLCLGLIALASGATYGIQAVRVADTSGCGNGFSYSPSPDLSNSGDEACAQQQSSRQATTWGLMGAGIAGIFLAAAVGMIAQLPEPKRDEARPEPFVEHD